MDSRAVHEQTYDSRIAIRIVCSAGILECPAKADGQTVTFTITRVKELNCDEGVGESCPNDYYPKIEIDNQGLDDAKGRFCCAHGTDFQPNWVFTAVIDSSHVTFPIHIELWDQDDLSADDQIDIANGPSSLDIVVDTRMCIWNGGGLRGLLNTQSSSSGSGSDSAQVYFTINIPTLNCKDTDGDGLLDVWETNGLDVDGDGIIDVDLPFMGADRLRKDLFLQIDFLAVPGGHTHAPLQAAIQQVVQAFANAPIPNIDGTTGVQLHVDVGALYGATANIGVTGTGGVRGSFGNFFGGGNQITETGNTVVDYDGSAGRPGTNFFTLKNMNSNRDGIFRYALFVHQTNFRAATNDCTSGWAKGIPGENFMVSLGGVNGAGNACWGTDATGQSVGTVNQQAGTLMHEFGHTLGLQHGGNDGLNNKPNYLSVMNYTFQPCSLVPNVAFGIPGGCDYSRITLAPLNENSLDECQGIDTGALGLGPVDFNTNARTEGITNCQPPNNTNVTANINSDTSADANNNGVQDPGEPPIFSTLNGFQDWGALVYNMRTVFDYATAGEPTDQEPDPQSIESARVAATKTMGAKLKLTKTGPANAFPGDTLSYSIALENKGANGSHGPALNVVITDTKPDATTQTLSIGMLALGSTSNNTLPYTVPCTTVDGTILKNTAQAHGVDLLNNPIDETSSAATTVHAPVMTLSLTASSTVNAGEAITYTIRYMNSGSASALNVVITNILPAEVYYSKALDLGTGPKPDTVTLNSDGTRSLVWKIEAVPPIHQEQTIVFTARPSLLALGGTVFADDVSLSYQSGPSCTAAVVNASANTSITVVPISPDHEKHRKEYWKEHAHEENAEILARIQATDQRYDGGPGSPPDGALSQAEVKAAFSVSIWTLLFKHDAPERLGVELMTLYFNLATRRLNADTPVSADDSRGLGYTNIRGAGLYGIDTMKLPFKGSNKKRYHESRESLDEIND